MAGSISVVFIGPRCKYKLLCVRSGGSDTQTSHDRIQNNNIPRIPPPTTPSRPLMCVCVCAYKNIQHTKEKKMGIPAARTTERKHTQNGSYHCSLRLVVVAVHVYRFYTNELTFSFLPFFYLKICRRVVRINPVNVSLDDSTIKKKRRNIENQKLLFLYLNNEKIKKI